MSMETIVVYFESMSRTQWIIIGIVAFILIFFVLAYIIDKVDMVTDEKWDMENKGRLMKGNP